MFLFYYFLLKIKSYRKEMFIMKNKNEKKVAPKRVWNLGFLTIFGSEEVPVQQEQKLDVIIACDNSCDCYSCDTCY